MSTTTLQFQFKVGGTLTAADSVVLSDPTGAYGVKRTDTNAVLVTDGTAMTAAQTGVYRYDLTVDPGVPLSWWAKATYNGVVYRFERETVTAVTVPAAYYGQLSDLYAVAGLTAIIQYSDLESTGVLDADRTQTAMSLADEWINSRLRRYVGVPVATSDTDFRLLTSAWALYAVAWLYRSGSFRDQLPDGSVDYSKPNGWEKQAQKLLDTYIEGRLNTLPPGTFQNIDLEYGTEARGVRVYPFGW